MTSQDQQHALYNAKVREIAEEMAHNDCSEYISEQIKTGVASDAAKSFFSDRIEANKGKATIAVKRMAEEAKEAYTEGFQDCDGLPDEQNKYHPILYLQQRGLVQPQEGTT